MLSKSKIFYVFHILLGFCGTLLIGFGSSYAIVAKNGVDFFYDSRFTILTIISGTIQLVACVLGSVGVLHKRLLLILMSNILHLGVGINLPVAIVALMTVYSNNFSEEVTILVQNGDLHSLEENFKCCGFDSPTSYYNSTMENYPSSCCGGVYPCIQPFDTGCVPSILDLLEMYFKVIGYVSCITFIIGLFFVVYFSSVKCFPWPVGVDGHIIKKQKEDIRTQKDKEFRNKLREVLKKIFIMVDRSVPFEKPVI